MGMGKKRMELDSGSCFFLSLVVVDRMGGGGVRQFGWQCRSITWVVETTTLGQGRLYGSGEERAGFGWWVVFYPFFFYCLKYIFTFLPIKN